MKAYNKLDKLINKICETKNNLSKLEAAVHIFKYSKAKVIGESDDFAYVSCLWDSLFKNKTTPILDITDIDEFLSYITILEKHEKEYLRLLFK